MSLAEGGSCQNAGESDFPTALLPGSDEIMPRPHTHVCAHIHRRTHPQTWQVLGEAPTLCAPRCSHLPWEWRSWGPRPEAAGSVLETGLGLRISMLTRVCPGDCPQGQGPRPVRVSVLCGMEESPCKQRTSRTLTTFSPTRKAPSRHPLCSLMSPCFPGMDPVLPALRHG